MTDCFCMVPSDRTSVDDALLIVSAGTSKTVVVVVSVVGAGIIVVQVQVCVMVLVLSVVGLPESKECATADMCDWVLVFIKEEVAVNESDLVTVLNAYGNDRPT